MKTQAAIIGGGVIGGGWAARFLLNGWDVAVYDPDPDCARKIHEVVGNARRSLPALYDRALPPEGNLTFHDSLAEATVTARWIQESVPERLDIKHQVFAQILHHAPLDAILGSSTSGFKPSELNVSGDRILVTHPFNPVYLLPLVEVVGEHTRRDAAAEVLRGIGMYPLHVHKEIDAHIADRFLEAVWREALWLIKDGVATTEDIDEAIRMGFGLRWAQMGLFETYRIAGGEAGMRHFLEQFGPALKWPWTKLMDVPDLDDALVDAIATQSDAQSGGKSIRELERLRDDNLVGMMRALKQNGSGAGGVINGHEASLPWPEVAGLPITLDRQVPQSWADYNGHMNETHFLEAGSKASDRLMELVGADAAYIASGKSFFTVENHVTYHDEVLAGERLRAETYVVKAEGKKLQLFHRLLRADGALAATVESLLLHVDLTTRRTSLPDAEVAEAMAAMAQAHAALPVPEGSGRV
jgi:carnitine 3-dehydrogenase